MSSRAWRGVALGAAFGVVVVGKQLYRDATADQLAAVLAPTAHAVAFVTRTPFHATAAGWLDASGTFLIAPACAGVNFALAAFLALCLGWLPRMTGAGAVARRLAAAAALAYGATLVVNTLRISIAVGMHRAAWSGGEAHELEGIAVYLAGLLALCAAVRAVERRRGDALAA